MEHGKIFNRMYPGPWIGESVSAVDCSELER